MVDEEVFQRLKKRILEYWKEQSMSLPKKSQPLNSNSKNTTQSNSKAKGLTPEELQKIVTLLYPFLSKRLNEI